MARHTLTIEPKSPRHKKLAERIKSRVKLGLRGQQDQHERWRKAENCVMAYVPESDADRLRKNKRTNSGEPNYTTIQLPYTYAMMMSVHTYLTSVFFSRSPVHQFSGRHGEGEMQIQAIEALVAYQVDVGEMLAPYYIWMYDGCKYGLGVLGSYWADEKIHYGQLVEYENPETGKVELLQTTEEIQGYRGNRSFNVSPWDFIWDSRFPVGQLQKGEFVGRRIRQGWNEVKRRENAGWYTNVDEIKTYMGERSTSEQSSSALKRPDLEQWQIYEDEDTTGKRVSNPAVVEFWEVVIELIPNEWDLGSSTMPQKWVFTVTENCNLIVGCSPLGYMHGKFPYDVIEPEIEGYGLMGRGIPDIMEPIQNTMDWLVNAHFFNVRASLNNQFLIDPSRVVMSDTEEDGPGFIWRLRPEAYGTDIRNSFMQIPVTDVTRQHVNDLQVMQTVAERALGVNDQIMGALGGSGRKTATEVRTTTSFGVNRQKTQAEWISASAFAPHAQKLVQTSQQKFDMEGKVRIVGDLANYAGQQFLSVTPDTIGGFFDFVPVDGTLPVDRMAQANLWKEILGTIARVPAIGAGYDLQKLFGWMATLAGIKNINQMKVQLAPPEQLQQQAVSGNTVPVLGPSSAVTPGNSASTAAGLNALLPPPAL